MSEWISVEERLPEDRTFVLAYCKMWAGDVSGIIRRVLFFDGEGFHVKDAYGVTHWMPLPEVPEPPEPPKQPESREPKAIRCPHCERWLPVEWAGWFRIVFFGQLRCPYCTGLLKLQTNLVKAGSTEDTK